MAPKTLLTLTTAGALFAACSTTTLTAQRYVVSPDNNEALKATVRSNIRVGPFVGPLEFDNRCRGMARIAPPKDETFPQYVQQALSTELQAIEGVGKNPSVVLSGAFEQLSFISTPPKGRWDISLRITSSNGETALVATHYEFESALSGITACKQTAEAYLPAVQSLIGTLLKSPEFKELISPSSADLPVRRRAPPG
jgi:hypothetical protein